jgi:hypothetical protein
MKILITCLVFYMERKNVLLCAVFFLFLRWCFFVRTYFHLFRIGIFLFTEANCFQLYFYSSQDLSRHFEANDLEFNIEDFDFMLDPILKRLRQIWRANQPTTSRPQQQAAECGGSSILGSQVCHSLPYELLGSSQPASSSSFESDAVLPPRSSNRSTSSSSRVERAAQQPAGVNTTPVSSLPGESGLNDAGGKSRVNRIQTQFLQLFLKMTFLT